MIFYFFLEHWEEVWNDDGMGRKGLVDMIK